jgi:catalase (peroxidase I)
VHLNRHVRIATIKLSGDPHNPLRMLDTATTEELKAEIMKHLKILAPVLDLEPLMALADGSAFRDSPKGGGDNGARALHHKKPPARHDDQCLGGASTGS